MFGFLQTHRTPTPRLSLFIAPCSTHWRLKTLNVTDCEPCPKNKLLNNQLGCLEVHPPHQGPGSLSWFTQSTAMCKWWMPGCQMGIRVCVCRGGDGVWWLGVVFIIHKMRSEGESSQSTGMRLLSVFHFFSHQYPWCAYDWAVNEHMKWWRCSEWANFMAMVCMCVWFH